MLQALQTSALAFENDLAPQIAKLGIVQWYAGSWHSVEHQEEGEEGGGEELQETKVHRPVEGTLTVVDDERHPLSDTVLQTLHAVREAAVPRGDGRDAQAQELAKLRAETQWLWRELSRATTLTADLRAQLRSIKWQTKQQRRDK